MIFSRGCFATIFNNSEERLFGCLGSALEIAEALFAFSIIWCDCVCDHALKVNTLMMSLCGQTYCRRRIDYGFQNMLAAPHETGCSMDTYSGLARKWASRMLCDDIISAGYNRIINYYSIHKLQCKLHTQWNHTRNDDVDNSNENTKLITIIKCLTVG